MPRCRAWPGHRRAPGVDSAACRLVNNIFASTCRSGLSVANRSLARSITLSRASGWASRRNSKIRSGSRVHSGASWSKPRRPSSRGVGRSSCSSRCSSAQLGCSGSKRAPVQGLPIEPSVHWAHPQQRNHFDIICSFHNRVVFRQQPGQGELMGFRQLSGCEDSQICPWPSIPQVFKRFFVNIGWDLAKLARTWNLISRPAKRNRPLRSNNIRWRR